MAKNKTTFNSKTPTMLSILKAGCSIVTHNNYVFRGNINQTHHAIETYIINNDYDEDAIGTFNMSEKGMSEALEEYAIYEESLKEE